MLACVAAEEILYWVGGLLLVRYVGLPWIRTHLFGPPQLPPGWSIATHKLGLVPTFVRRGLRWAIAVRLPINDESTVELEARVKSDVTPLRGLNALFRLRAELPSEPADSSETLTVDAREVIPEGLIVRSKSKGEAAASRRDRTARGEETDDLQNFFDCVSIDGNEALIVALLDEETRSLLRISVHELGFVIDRGVIHLRAAGLSTNHPHLEQVLLRMTQIVRALSIEAIDILPRLEQIAANDRCPEARARALEVMASAFQKDRIQAAFERARDDVSPIVRLRVIATVTSTLEELVAVLLDPLTRPATIREAIRVAVRRFRRKDVEACLLKLFRERKKEPSPLRLMLIEAIARMKLHDVAAEIAALADDPDGRTREATARALGLLGARQWERRLIALLEDRETAVVVAAVKALGFCGTIAAIAPLRATWGKKTLIDEAVARIVAREGLPHAGTLALVGAGASGGELAMATAGAGALSEPEADLFEEEKDEETV
jgi:HEAT repeat protein